MEEYNNNKILVVAGPTATGKSKLALSLASELSGEIISADSMQIYKHLDVGTAKPTIKERQAVKHHLVDFLEPCELFNVSDFHNRCEQTADDIFSRNKVPIICGGTGLYISTFINGIKFSKNTSNLEVRQNLKQRAQKEGLLKLYDELLKVDKDYAKRIETNDEKRILRALEIFIVSGQNATTHEMLSKQTPSKYNPMTVVLVASNRQYLYDRIEKRIDEMVEEGLLDEARLVFENKDVFKTAAQAIGYKEFFNYFDGNETLKQAVLMLKQATRRYAKRQITWFKRHSKALTYDICENSLESIKNDIIKQWENFRI